MLDEADEGLHFADTPLGSNWQENMFFSGFDLDAGAGYGLHVKLQPSEETADVRAFVIAGGESVGAWARHPMQASLLYPNLSIDVDEPFRAHRLHFRGAGVPTASTAGYFGLAIEGPSPVDIGIDLELRSPLVPMDWAQAMADTPVAGTGDGHYDQGYEFTGRLRVGAAAVDVRGRGWRDHSWGPRDLSSVSVMFNFVTADDLSHQLSAVRVNMPDGTTSGFAFIGDHERVQLLGAPRVDVVDGVEEPGKLRAVETRVGDRFVRTTVRANVNVLLLPEGYRAGEGHGAAEIEGHGTGYGYLEVGASMSSSDVEDILASASSHST